MLKSVPREEIRMVNPMRILERYAGGKLCESSRNMNPCPKQDGQKRTVYDLSGVLPQEGLSKEERPSFLHAMVQLMLDNMIDAVYHMVDTKSMKTASRT
eukprot:1928894-Karenia_brevis.AAC.1